MSQIKTFKHNTHFITTNSNISVFLLCFSFIKELKKALLNKGVLLNDFSLFVCEDKSLFIHLSLFYRTKLSTSYRSQFYKKNKYVRLTKNQSLYPFFVNSKTNSLHFVSNSLSLLNKRFDFNLLVFFFSIFIRFKSLLFLRKLNLYFDGIKILSLFNGGMVPINLFLFFLSELFCYTTKKKHTVYFFFIKLLFHQMILNSVCSIKGIRFVVSGKLLGKTRSSKHLISLGSVPLQTKKNRLYFQKSSVYTLFGAFGFKLWISV